MAKIDHWLTNMYLSQSIRTPKRLDRELWSLLETATGRSILSNIKDEDFWVNIPGILEVEVLSHLRTSTEGLE